MDKYTQFTFNGVHSSAYNLFYTNDGGLSYPFSPSFTQNVVRPMYQGRSYYLGTDVGENVYKFTFAAEKLTNAERRAIFDWLDIGKPGYIKFDAFPNYSQKVIITSIGDGSLYLREWTNGLVQNIIEFPVTMETVGNPYPQTDLLHASYQDAEVIVRDPETLLPVIKAQENKFNIYNWTSINQYYTLGFNANQTATVSLDEPVEKTIYEIKKALTQMSVTIDGETGVSRLLSEGGVIAEQSAEVYSDGPLVVPPALIFNGRAKFNFYNPLIKSQIANFFDVLAKRDDIGDAMIAIIPAQQETTTTQVLDGASKGSFPAHPISKVAYSPYFSEGTVESYSTLIDDLLANLVLYPWIENKEMYYHFIIAEPYIINLYNTTNAWLEMSYRNRL